MEDEETGVEAAAKNKKKAPKKADKSVDIKLSPGNSKQVVEEFRK